MSGDLTEENVRQIYQDCVLQQKAYDAPFNGTFLANILETEGYKTKAIFRVTKISSHVLGINAMLFDLGAKFTCEGGGDVMSNMNRRRDGIIWTVNPHYLEKLLLLGLAVDTLHFVLPRHMWSFIKGDEPLIVMK